MLNFRIYLSSYGVLAEYAKTRPATFADFLKRSGRDGKPTPYLGYAERRQLFADSSA
jgi:hypothetical protein